jgi:hypothetical protein
VGGRVENAKETTKSSEELMGRMDGMAKEKQIKKLVPESKICIRVFEGPLQRRRNEPLKKNQKEKRKKRNK